MTSMPGDQSLPYPHYSASQGMNQFSSEAPTVDGLFEALAKSLPAGTSLAQRMSLASIPASMLSHERLVRELSRDSRVRQASLGF